MLPYWTKICLTSEHSLIDHHSMHRLTEAQLLQVWLQCHMPRCGYYSNNNAITQESLYAARYTHYLHDRSGTAVSVCQSTLIIHNIYIESLGQCMHLLCTPYSQHPTPKEVMQGL